MCTSGVQAVALVYKQYPSLYTERAQVGHWLGHMCAFPSSFSALTLLVSQLGHCLFTFVNKAVSNLGTPNFTAVVGMRSIATYIHTFAKFQENTTILSRPVRRICKRGVC